MIWPDASTITEWDGTIVAERRIHSLNVLCGRHWRFKANDKRRWKLLLASLTVGMRKPVHPVPVLVHVVSVRTQRIKDSDNLIGGAKHMRDALKEVGILHDDSDELCKFQFDQMTKKQAGRKTEATIIRWRAIYSTELPKHWQNEEGTCS